MRWVSGALSLVMTSGSDKTQINICNTWSPQTVCISHTQTHTHTHTHTHTLPESQLRLCHYDFCTTYQEIFVDTRRDLRNEHILLSYPFPLQILSTRFMSSFVLDVRDSTKEGTALALGN